MTRQDKQIIIDLLLSIYYCIKHSKAQHSVQRYSDTSETINFFQSMIQCMYSPTQGTLSLKEDTDQEIDQSLLEAGLMVIKRN